MAVPARDRYGLALHTSSPQLGLGLGSFAGDWRSQTWELGRELSTYLHQYLADFLPPQTWQSLSFIAAARGPGSFTSTRLGLVTARTLAQQLEIPLFAISSLAAFAWSRRNLDGAPPLIAVEMPGTGGQIYGGIYRQGAGNLRELSYLPEALLSPEVWQETLEALPAPYQCLPVPEHLGENVTSLLEIADLEWQQGERPHWSAALPFYGN